MTLTPSTLRGYANMGEFTPHAHTHPMHHPHHHPLTIDHLPRAVGGVELGPLLRQVGSVVGWVLGHHACTGLCVRSRTIPEQSFCFDVAGSSTLIVWRWRAGNSHDLFDVHICSIYFTNAHIDFISLIAFVGHEWHQSMPVPVTSRL